MVVPAADPATSASYLGVSSCAESHVTAALCGCMLSIVAPAGAVVEVAHDHSVLVVLSLLAARVAPQAQVSFARLVRLPPSSCKPHGVIFMAVSSSCIQRRGLFSASLRTMRWCVTSPAEYSKCSSGTSVFPSHTPTRQRESRLDVLRPPDASSRLRANTVSKRLTQVPL